MDVTGPDAADRDRPQDTGCSSSKTPPTPTSSTKPPRPLAALAPDITVYVTGLSKSVATGLRVGFVAAPTSLVAAIERAIRATTWNTPAITTAIACRWLDDGTVGRLEADKRRDARERQAIAREALTGLPHHRPSVVLLRLAPAGRRLTR